MTKNSNAQKSAESKGNKGIWKLPTLEANGRMPTEHEEQRDFVRWFRQTFPGVRIFAVPNGGLRSAREGARLRAEGVSAGVPDLCIPAWDMWIEMKRPPTGKRGGGAGRVRAEQDDWHEYLTGIGHLVVVCYTSAEAQAAASDRFDEVG